jgi:hypothetical protein
MAKPMTEKQKTRWPELRTRGWAWFVFVRSPYRYAVPWGLLMLAFTYFHPLGGQWYGWKRELPVLAIISVLLGLSCALLEWRRKEQRFQEAGASGTPTV